MEEGPTVHVNTHRAGLDGPEAEAGGEDGEDQDCGDCRLGEIYSCPVVVTLPEPSPHQDIGTAPAEAEHESHNFVSQPTDLAGVDGQPHEEREDVGQAGFPLEKPILQPDVTVVPDTSPGRGGRGQAGGRGGGAGEPHNGS